jgi:hypothetical protein
MKKLRVRPDAFETSWYERNEDEVEVVGGYFARGFSRPLLHRRYQRRQHPSMCFRSKLSRSVMDVALVMLYLQKWRGGE